MTVGVDFLKAVYSATFWSSVLLTYLLYRRRKAAGARFLSLLMVCTSIWTGGVLLGLLVSTIPLKELSLAITYSGFTLSPSIFLAFAFDYTGQKKWLKWKYFIPLSIFPVTILIFNFIPQCRHLLWNINSASKEFNSYDYSIHPIFWIYIIYSYLIVFASIIVLSKKINLLKKQNLVMLIAIIFPFVFNLIQLFYLGIISQIDITPIGFALTVATLFFGIYNLQFFNLLPVAREMVIELIDNAVVVTDKHSRIVLHNHIFDDNFNPGKTKLVGKHLANIFPELNNFIQSSDLTNKKKYYEFIFRNKTYDLTINPIHRVESVLAGKITVLHDVTHRKNILDKLQLSNQQLQDQLSINESLLEDLKGFSRTVAHNLKSPLNSLLGFGEILNQELADDSYQKELATRIVYSGLKMSKIIDEILLFSSISIKEIICEPVIMDSVIKEAIKRNEKNITQRNGVIMKPAKWPEAMGYAPWIEEVWDNLISNAIRYGGTPPVLTFGYSMPNSNQIIFYLQDNGNGLSPEQIEKLFVPFGTRENNREDNYDLGLYIVKRIIAKLKGEVWVESENIPGEGSRFCFMLPSK